MNQTPLLRCYVDRRGRGCYDSLVRKNPLLDRLAAYPILELNRRKAAVLERKGNLYDFGTGDPREPTPEFIRQAVRAAVPEVSSYPSIRGTPQLREAIGAYLGRRFGLDLDPHTHVLPSSGSKEAIFHLPLLVIDPHADDRVVVFPDPGYPAYQRGVLFAGGAAYAQRLDGDFLQRPWALPAEIVRRTRMLIINTPHNPTGSVMGLDHLRRVWSFCREHDILLVNDECYADIYQDAPPASLLEVSTEGVLVLHSLSKRSGMTGYRSGFIAGDPTVIEALAGLRANPGLAPMDFVNAGAAAAWSDDAHAAARRDVFRAKKEIMMAFFERVGLEVVASEATFYIWLRARAGETGEGWAMKLLEHGIVVCPGDYLGVGDAGAGYVRVALVPTVAACHEAVALWGRLL